MSLDPHWFSTDLRRPLHGRPGALGAGVRHRAAWRCWAASRRSRGVLRPEQVHDLGKLLLAFVMLWAYVTFSQFLIIWSGNLPEEIPGTSQRLHGGWQCLALALVLFHFALPFLLLLSRDLKRNARTLARGRGLVLVMRVVDLYWLIAPDLAGHHGALHGAACIRTGWTWRRRSAIGGLWLVAVRARAARAGRCCRWASPRSRSCWRRTRRDRPPRAERHVELREDRRRRRGRRRSSALGIAVRRRPWSRWRWCRSCGVMVGARRRGATPPPPPHRAATSRAGRPPRAAAPGASPATTRRALRARARTRCSASYGWVDERRPASCASRSTRR